MRRCRPLTSFGLCLLCGFLLTGFAAAQDQNPRALQPQIVQHEKALAEALSARNQREVASELNALGSLYRQAGDTQKALDDCNEALQIDQSTANRLGAAQAQNTLGRIYTDTGQEQKALDLFNQTLPVWRQFGSRLGEATALTNIGRVYNNLGQREDTVKYINQALPIWRELKNDEGVANALDVLGTAYSYMGRGAEALDQYNQALPLWRKSGERAGEALTLGNMAIVYDNLGEEQKSLEFFNQALMAWREVGNRAGEARALNFMGRAYSDLGQKQKALEIYNQALPIWRAVKNPTGEALALNDIGRVYSDIGQDQKALDFYGQALPLWRQAGNRPGEALTLTNTGRSYSTLGQQSKALELDFQSLAVWREVEDQRGQALALSSISSVYARTGQPEQAVPINLAALVLAKDSADPEIEGGIETSLMIEFRSQDRPEEAILFGTDAVNSFQQVRRNITGLDQDLQTGFAQSKSVTYRMLAELLLQEDRLGEAEQVLDLLKEQELKEVVRGAPDSAGAKLEPLQLTTDQQKAQSELATPEKSALALTDLSAQYATLSAKATRTPEETAQLKDMGTKIEAQNGEVSDFFKKTLYPELAQRAGTADANALLSKEKSEVSQLQNTLAELGPNVMGIRLQVRDDLRNPSSDPKPHLAELYAMVVAPFADELSTLERNPQAGHVPTLLWSLDGAMRYLPMAALYDGQHYMVERFNNILFTPESYGHMTASSQSDKSALRVLAMGLSKSYGGLPALPGVLPELDAVVRDPSAPDSHGPMDGVLLPNEQFTYAALETQLGAGSTFPWSTLPVILYWNMEAEMSLT